MTPTDPTLRPCFFCGDPIYPRESNTWKGNFCYCGRCAHVYEISPLKWNSAYCWKLLDKKEARIRELEKVLRMVWKNGVCAGDLKDQVKESLEIYK